MAKSDNEPMTPQDVEKSIAEFEAISSASGLELTEDDKKKLREYAEEGLTPDEAVERILSED